MNRFEVTPDVPPVMVSVDVVNMVNTYSALDGRLINRFRAQGNNIVTGKVATQAVIGISGYIKDVMTNDLLCEVDSPNVCAIGGTNELSIAAAINGERVDIYNLHTGQQMQGLTETNPQNDGDPESVIIVTEKPTSVVIGGVAGQEMVLVNYEDSNAYGLHMAGWELHTTRWRKKKRFGKMDHSLTFLTQGVPALGENRSLAAGENMVAVADTDSGLVNVFRRYYPGGTFEHDFSLNANPRQEESKTSLPNFKGEWGGINAFAIGKANGTEVVAGSWEEQLAVYTSFRGVIGTGAELLFKVPTAAESSSAPRAMALAIGQIAGQDSLIAGYSDGAIRVYDVSDKKQTHEWHHHDLPIAKITI